MDVYVVESEGVYRQGVYLVANTRGEAQAFVDNYSPDLDGYHQWVITKYTLGQPTAGIHAKHAKTQVMWGE